MAGGADRPGEFIGGTGHLSGQGRRVRSVPYIHVTAVPICYE
jgi:hypothetical protein